jgi:hypothetical protein
MKRGAKISWQTITLIVVALLILVVVWVSYSLSKGNEDITRTERTVTGNSIADWFKNFFGIKKDDVSLSGGGNDPNTILFTGLLKEYQAEFEALRNQPTSKAKCTALIRLFSKVFRTRSIMEHIERRTGITNFDELIGDYSWLLSDISISFSNECEDTNGEEIKDILKYHPVAAEDFIERTAPIPDTWDILQPTTCIPDGSPYFEQGIPEYGPGEFQPPSVITPEHILVGVLSVAGIALIAYGGYIILVPILEGCLGTALMSGTTATVTAAVTQQAATRIAPIISMRIGQGITPLAITGALAAATNEKNQGNSGSLEPLTANEAEQVINGLTPKDNKKYAEAYKRACDKLQPCEEIETGIHPNGATFGPITPGFTPTEEGDSACTSNPNSPRPPVTPITHGANNGFNQWAKIYFDAVEEFANPHSDPEFMIDPNEITDPTGTIQEIGFLDENGAIILYNPNNPNAPISIHQSSYALHEFAVDFTNYCAQNPDSRVTFGLRVKFKSKSCGSLYTTYFGSYDCRTGETRNEEPEPGQGPVIYTHGAAITGGTATLPDIFIKLLGIIKNNRLTGGTTRPLQPITQGPQICSGNLCSTPGNQACPANQYCTNGCVCAQNVCGDAYRGNGEACDPVAGPSNQNPNGPCPQNFACSLNCQCVQINRPVISGGVVVDDSGGVLESSGEAFIESWRITSRGPQDPVEITYGNNKGETSQGTYNLNPFQPLSITDTTGELNIYNYDSEDKLQDVSTGNKRIKYHYDINGKLERIEKTRGRFKTIHHYHRNPGQGGTYFERIDEYIEIPTIKGWWYFGNLLELVDDSRRLKGWMPLSEYIIIRETNEDKTYEKIKTIADLAYQGYTTEIEQWYNSEGKTTSKQITYDYDGDGTYERQLIYYYDYDEHGRIISITTGHGRIYTYHYSETPESIDEGWRLTSLLKITDNEGRDVTEKIKEWTVDY